jgi:hypothetical protein
VKGNGFTAAEGLAALKGAQLTSCGKIDPHQGAAEAVRGKSTGLEAGEKDGLKGPLGPASLKAHNSPLAEKSIRINAPRKRHDGKSTGLEAGEKGRSKRALRPCKF